MKLSRIKETCLYIEDLEKAREFYHGKLELEIIHYLPKKHLFLRVGDSVLLCFNPEDAKHKTSPPAHFAYGPQHFAFEVSVADYAAWLEKIRNLGIIIKDEITWNNGQKSFYFEDPAQNILEIVPEGIWD